jgi:hypothetical protein
MKKLSKAQVAERDQIANDLRAGIEAWESAVADLNDAIGRAVEFRDGLVAEMDEYMGERSERWPESEGGQQYAEWHDSWEQFDLELVEDTHGIDVDGFADLPAAPGE